jgi:hypothetical protein
VVLDDIDHDGDLDLIWLSGAGKRTAVVWINNGSGNFAKADNNTPYEAELAALSGGGDGSDPFSLEVRHPTSGLGSSASFELGVAADIRFRCPAIGMLSFVGVRGFTSRSGYLSYLHKRGPPR